MNAQIDNLSLHSFNTGLEQLGLPTVHEDTFAQILGITRGQELQMALNRAPTDANARMYLERKLQEAGCPLMADQDRAGPAIESVKPDPTDAAVPYYSLTVYGQSAALCVREDTTRSRKPGLPGNPTVRLEAAPANPNKPRDYLWDKKTAVQFSRSELPIVTAVFYGAASECRFTGHGEGHTKGFEIKNQAGRIFVSIFDKGVSYGIPIMPGESFYVAGLLLRQLKKAQPWLDGMDVNTLLTRVCGRLLNDKISSAKR